MDADTALLITQHAKRDSLISKWVEKIDRKIEREARKGEHQCSIFCERWVFWTASKAAMDALKVYYEERGYEVSSSGIWIHLSWKKT